MGSPGLYFSAMWNRVASYTAIVQSQGNARDIAQVFAVVVEFAGGNMQMDTTDGGTFAAWMAVLSSGRAEFNHEANQLRVQG